MSIDPYKSGMVVNPYSDKTDLSGFLVAKLDLKLRNRGLQLINPASRCIIKNEVHELILTNEDVSLGGKVDNVFYIGFYTANNSGVMVRDDLVYINDEQIGIIAGFDETHMPNHLNIIIKTDKDIFKLENIFKINDKILITKTN